MEELPSEPRNAPAGGRKIIYLSIIVFSIIVACSAWYAVQRVISAQNTLPKSVVSSVNGFKPYYFKDNRPPDGFNLKPKSTSYDENVLIFSVKNKAGQLVAVSEQLLPLSLTPDMLKADQTYTLPFGKATLGSIANSRTIATLTTKDSTFITLSTSDKLDPDTLKDFLKSLAPLKY